MRLVDNDKIIITKIIHQCIRRLSRLQTGKMSGIILDSGAKTSFFHHLQIKISPLTDSLCFQKLVLTLKICNLLPQFFFNRFGCLQNSFHGHHIMRCRIEGHMIQFPLNLTGQHIHLCYSVHFIPEKFYPDRHI